MRKEVKIALICCGAGVAGFALGFGIWKLVKKHREKVAKEEDEYDFEYEEVEAPGITEEQIHVIRSKDQDGKKIIPEEFDKPDLKELYEEKKQTYDYTRNQIPLKTKSVEEAYAETVTVTQAGETSTHHIPIEDVVIDVPVHGFEIEDISVDLNDYDDGQWMPITRADYDRQIELQEFDQLSATYFASDQILAGYDDDLWPIDDEELFGRVFLAVRDNPGIAVVYFQDPNQRVQLEIDVTEDSYQDAYVEWVQSGNMEDRDV